MNRKLSRIKRLCFLFLIVSAVFMVTFNFTYEAKAALVTGERILNGGFETGDLTNWGASIPDLWPVNQTDIPFIIVASGCSGSNWQARSDGTSQIAQDFDPPINVTNIISASARYTNKYQQLRWYFLCTDDTWFYLGGGNWNIDFPTVCVLGNVSNGIHAYNGKLIEKTVVWLRGIASGWSSIDNVSIIEQRPINVSSTPEINAEFKVNGTSYTTSQNVYLNQSDPYNFTVVDTSKTVGATAYNFSHWLIGGSTYYGTEQIFSFNSTYFSLNMVYEFGTCEDTFNTGWTTLNVDGDFSLSAAEDQAYYNPHATGSIDSWSIVFGDYATFTLDSNSTDSGHIAAGTWWYNWTGTCGQRLNISSHTLTVEADIRVRRANYDSGAWLRIAVAAAFWDPSGYSGYDVKYTELDVWDSPAALNDTFGDAAGGGNVIYGLNDVVEWRYDSIPLNTWRSYKWNLTQYIEAAWGDVMTDAALESVYLVIEIINGTGATVDLDNFWLKILNSTDPSVVYSYWDAIASEVTAQNATVKWTGAMRNSTGYSVFATVHQASDNINRTFESMPEDNLDGFFTVTVNGSAYIDLFNDTSQKMAGSHSLRLNVSRPSGTVAYLNHTYAAPQDWTNASFLVFHIWFNGSNEYYHRLRIYDGTYWFEWEIRDTNHTLHAGQWNKVTLPLERPSVNSGAPFNYSNVEQIWFVPYMAYANRTEAYDMSLAYVWLDIFWLDQGIDAYVSFNVPMDANANYTLFSKKEYTGHDGRYEAFLQSTGSVNASGLQFLRPRYIDNWAPVGIFNVSDAANNGISLYNVGLGGQAATVTVGESHTGQTLTTGGAPTFKLLVRLKLPPNDDWQIINGSWQQEFTWGAISELKLALFVETNMTEFWGVALNVDLEGCGDWVFAEWKYYNFNLTFTDLAGQTFDYVFMRFETSTFDGDVNSTFTYDHAVALNRTWTVDYTPADTDAEPTRISAGQVVSNSTALNPVFEVWFTKDLIDVYTNDTKINVYLRANTTAGLDSGWVLAFPLSFNIYVRGGFSTELTTGGNFNAGRLGGGDVFDLWAQNGSYVQTDLWYRHLQHIKMRPEIQAYVGYPSFTITFYVYYCTQNDDWVQGWTLELLAVNATYGIERHFAWNVTWTNPQSGEVKGPETIWAFHGGDAAAPGAATYTWLWIDLWFNKINGSSFGGGRVNAYMYAMKDSSNDWLRWLNTDWGPYDALQKESMFFTQMLDPAGAVVHAPQIKLVKIVTKLNVQQDAVESQWVELKNFEVFDTTIGDLATVFQGVQTPTFEETITPVMPMGGWMGAIWTGIMGLGAYLADNIVFGGLSLWPTFVAFLDTLAAYAGFPNLFSNLFSWLNSGWLWMVNSFTYLILLLTPMFSLLGESMGKFVTVVTTAATQWVAMLQQTWLLLDGAYTSGVHLYNDLGISQWIVLGLILYPLHLVILWDVWGLDPVEREIRIIWDVLNFLFSLFIRVAELIINVIGTIIESIPVIE